MTSIDRLDLGRLIQGPGLLGELHLVLLHVEGTTSVISHPDALCTKGFA